MGKKKLLTKTCGEIACSNTFETTRTNTRRKYCDLCKNDKTRKSSFYHNKYKTKISENIISKNLSVIYRANGSENGYGLKYLSRKYFGYTHRNITQEEILEFLEETKKDINSQIRYLKKQLK